MPRSRSEVVLTGGGGGGGGGGITPGGGGGRDLSRNMGDWDALGVLAADVVPRDRFRRRAMSDSWQLMQKIPCDVRA